MNSLPMRSLDEEIVNAYTHLAWAILSVVFGMIFLLDSNVPVKFKTASIMMTGLSGWTFLSSFLYHFTKNKKKAQNREVDKTSIFLMIMGCGVAINMTCFDSVAAAVSCLALIVCSCGLTMIYSHIKSPSEVFSLTSYVLLGWLCILPITGIVGENLYSVTSSSWLIIAGGIAYSVGVLFYAKDSIKWNHTRWHICVMLGYSFHLAGHYRVIQHVSIT